MEAQINSEEKGVTAVKKRIVSVELLRIISMMMVVMLHYLSKGNFLQPLTGEFGTNSYIAWFLEAFCIVAVNVYMLISGYFLVESSFKLGRLGELVCQVMFYSVCVPVVLIVLGVIPVGELGIYRLAQYVLPIHMEQYWFATAYVLMYLFAPLLASAARSMEKKQLQITIVLLLLFLSVPKSVIPVTLTLDSLGYDALWFMCVFLVAAYIRLHGIPFFTSSKRGILCYGVCALLIFGWTMLLRLICLKTGALESFVQNAYHYNHILNLLAAVSLFYGFIHWNISAEGKVARFICRVAPYTFGVYLLHEHAEIRWLWPNWCGADLNEAPLMMIVRAVLSVFAVFVVGILMDMVRGVLFGCFKKFWRKMRG